MEDSLKKRYIIKLLTSIVVGVINIVLVAIVPKALGPVAFGQFSYLQQFFAQATAFLDAGTSTAFFTKISARNNRKELITYYFQFSIFLLFLLIFFIYMFDTFDYISILLPDIDTKYIYLGLYFGFFTWLTQIFIKISDAYALTVSVELIKISHKVFSLLLLLFIINMFNFDLEKYFYFHYISLVSFLVILLFLFMKKNVITGKALSFKIEYKKLTDEFISFSSPLFVFNIIGIFVAFFDIWLLQHISGSIQTGFYGLAYSIAAMCFLFTGAMTPIITREFSKAYGEKNIDEIKMLFKRYIPMLYAIAAYFSIFIAFESQNLLLIFTDEKFKDAYFVLIIMAFYPIHQTYGQLSGSLFFAMGETKKYRNIGIFSSLLGLIFSYIFVYILELGAVGFAWKMILIQIITVNIQLYFNIKVLNIKMMPFLKHQVTTLLFFIILGYLSTQFIFPNDFGVYSFLIKGVLYTLFVVIGIFLIPSIFAINKSQISKIISGVVNKIR